MNVTAFVMRTSSGQRLGIPPTSKPHAPGSGGVQTEVCKAKERRKARQVGSRTIFSRKRAESLNAVDESAQNSQGGAWEKEK